MKLYFSFLIILLSSVGTAQISILKDDYLLLGDTARISVATDNSIDFETTGPNSFWDYSYLEATQQRLVNPFSVANASIAVQFRFGPIAPARYASDYYQSVANIPFGAASGLLPVDFQDYFIFTKITDDSISNPGYAFLIEGNDVPFRSDTIEVPYRFPLEYGGLDSSRAYSKIDFNPFFDGIFIQYRQRRSEVDGHGTLITPYGTFNTLRIKHIINEQDSIYVDLFGFEQWIPINQPTTRQYEWWAKNEKVPVLKITTTEIQGTENVTEITYKDVYLGLDASIEEQKLVLDLFPNPSDNVLHIQVAQHIDQVRIINNLGKVMLEKSNINGNSISLNVSELAPGNYTILVISGQQTVNRKIVINR